MSLTNLILKLKGKFVNHKNKLMKRFLLLTMLLNTMICSSGQILKVSTTPALISSQISGNSKSFSSNEPQLYYQFK